MAVLSSSHEPLLILLLGPTGSGKTHLSLRLAERFGGEILSCDSVAVYRGLEIGSAKPSPNERARVPHHLLDIADPSEAMTAGDWARSARAVAREVASRGRLPIVTGGTGLYLRAMIDGLAPLPARCPIVRGKLSAASARRGGSPYLHRMLRRLDADAAERIHPNDEPKLIRALEVALLSREPISNAGRDPLQGFRLLRIGLEPARAQLYERLNTRAAAMFQNGLLGETRSLRVEYGVDAPALGALGYREASAVLEGAMALPDAISAVQQGHRNYAKRQMTWFRKEPDVHWLPGFGDSETIAQSAEDLVRAAQAKL